MASGIELREKEQVLEVYRDYEYPNFMILAGNQPRLTYKGGNIDEGYGKLESYLNIIEQSGTSGTYSLRVFPDNVTQITNKTPYEASTTFMLNSTKELQKNADGVIVVNNRPGQQPAPSAYNADLAKRLEALEADNRRLQAALMDERIKAIEQKFEARIAGLSAAEPEKSGWDRAGEWFDKILEKPDAVKSFIGGIRDVILGGEQKDYIQRPAAATVAGTNKTTDTMPKTQDEQLDGTDAQTGPLENALLSAEEKNLDKKQQAALLTERLGKLTEEQIEDVQYECMDNLEDRIGSVTLTRLLLALACMDDKSLNMVLNYLD